MLSAERVDSYTKDYLKHLFKPNNYGEIYGAETGIIAVKYGDYNLHYALFFLS